MELTPFSIVNQYLKERLIHPSRYTCKKYSFLKTFQHALSFALNGTDSKLIKNYLEWPYFMQLLIYSLKSLRGKYELDTYRFKETIILEPGRVVSDDTGQWHSMYFDKIAKTLGRENISVLCLENDGLLECNYKVSKLSRVLPYPDKVEREMLREMLDVLRRAKKTPHFTKYELKHLHSAMHIFFEEFRFYYHLLKGKGIKHLLYICHYHREGMIAATKLLGISNIEFQHGLIATNDLYYVYHEQFAGSIAKAFFPDKLVVYGPYWKRILQLGCEFRSKQILIGGDYLYRQNKVDFKKGTKSDIVLVCAQKNLHEDYVQYCKKLAAHIKLYPEWKAIVKLHPLERNKEAYEELRALGIEIVGIEQPLDELLSKCKIQISIYSTTFYDALGFDVVNFSLQNFGSMSDYASDMISEGVALPLHEDESPIEKFLSEKDLLTGLLPRDEVYAPYQEEVIRQLIQEKSY